MRRWLGMLDHASNLSKALVDQTFKDMESGPAPLILTPRGQPNLTYVQDTAPGIRRLRAGKGFSYRDDTSGRITDPETLTRIRALAIPPAWTDVWISRDPGGHIQATGRDARGRKQYRYHDGWAVMRSGGKYGRMAEFGRALPRLRAQVEADLALRGPVREKVLATVVRLLELTLIRVGNKEYARQNRSYGLTTLNKRHVGVDGAALKFHFKGKSGVEHRTSVRDRRLSAILKRLHELPGQQLFKYRDASGNLIPVESADVNDYIRDAIGAGFSAKDFRTWAATLTAARELSRLSPGPSDSQTRKTVTACVRQVAAMLGNTVAVCRSSYIHPRVIEAFAAGTLSEAFPDPDDSAFESALIAFLDRVASPDRPGLGA